MDNQLSFGKKLKMLRVGKGLTQEEMANKLGISRRAYIPYEQDKAKPRNEATYQKMAEILSCDANDLKDTISPTDKQNYILNLAIGIALGAVGLSLPFAGIASIPFIAASASSLTTAALSMSEKKKNQTNDPPENKDNLLKPFSDRQIQFHKAAREIITDDLIQRHILFSPIDVDLLEDYGVKPHGYFQVYNNEIQSWWFSYWHTDPELGMNDIISPRDWAGNMISKYTIAAFDPHRKVSLVVDDGELFDALIAYRNHNCYRGIMSAILVNTESRSIVKEETIADLDCIKTTLPED